MGSLNLERRLLGNTGVDVPILSYGTSQFGDIKNETEEAQAIESLRHALLKYNINYFDTSPYYGSTLAETVLGKALKGIPREKYHVSTKLGRYGYATFDFSAASIRKNLDASLKRIGLSYVDVCLLHDVEFGSLEQIVNEAIPTLMELKREGKLRYIGVSGYPLKVFDLISKRSRDLDVMQTYCHYVLYDTSLQSLLQNDEFEKANLGIINASPYGMGLLTMGGPPDWHPASDYVKSVCKSNVEFCKSQLKIDIESMAINFSLAYPKVHTTLVGARCKEFVDFNVYNTVNKSYTDEQLQIMLEKYNPIRDKLWVVGRDEWN